MLLTAGWESRWVESTYKGAEQGKFAWTAGKFYNDAEKDKGKHIWQVDVYVGFSVYGSLIKLF